MQAIRMWKIIKISIILLYEIGYSIEANNSCDVIPAALQRMTRGIDLTALDLFPADLSQTNGFRRNLFTLSCNKSRKWIHPFDETLLFDIPDQVDTINTIPGGVINTQTVIYDNIVDLKKSMQIDVGLGFDTLTYGAFSSSGSYRSAQQSLINSTKSIIQVSAYVSAVQIDLNPYWELSANQYFNEFVEKQLPDTYEQNTGKYDEFVDTYGTHYFESGCFGGFVKQTIEMYSRTALKMSEQEVRLNAEASFFTFVKLYGGYEGTNRNISIDFLANTQSYSSYYGGKTNLMNGTNIATHVWSDWWESVARDPWLFAGKLKPISVLISGNKKEELNKAIVSKLDKAYLEELKHSLLLFAKSFKVLVDNHVSQIDQLLTQNIVSHENVLSIGKNIDQFLAIETAKIDKLYLQSLQTNIESLENYELYCKHMVAQKCNNELNKQVNDSIFYAKQLYERVESLKNQLIPNREEFNELSRTVEKFIAYEKSKRFDECHDKLFCNLCRIVVIDIELRSKCYTNEIKYLLNIPL